MRGGLTSHSEVKSPHVSSHRAAHAGRGAMTAGCIAARVSRKWARSAAALTRGALRVHMTRKAPRIAGPTANPPHMPAAAPQTLPSMPAVPHGRADTNARASRRGAMRDHPLHRKQAALMRGGWVG